MNQGTAEFDKSLSGTCHDMEKISGVFPKNDP